MLCISALALLTSPYAKAEPVFVDFQVLLQLGPLDGQVFNGDFSVEGEHFTRTGTEEFTPANENKRLLSFQIEIDGTSFSMADDVEFPLSPIVTFSHGLVTSLTYIGNPQPFVLTIIALDVSYIDAEEMLSAGIVSSVAERPSRVPEPGSLVLLAIAMAGIMVVRRRHAARAGRRP